MSKLWVFSTAEFYLIQINSQVAAHDSVPSSYPSFIMRRVLIMDTSSINLFDSNNLLYPFLKYGASNYLVYN